MHIFTFKIGVMGRPTQIKNNVFPSTKWYSLLLGSDNKLLKGIIIKRDISIVAIHFKLILKTPKMQSTTVL